MEKNWIFWFWVLGFGVFFFLGGVIIIFLCQEGEEEEEESSSSSWCFCRAYYNDGSSIRTFTKCIGRSNLLDHGFGEGSTNSAWLSGGGGGGGSCTSCCLWYNAGSCAFRDHGEILPMPTSRYLQESDDRGCEGCTSLHYHTRSLRSHGKNQNPWWTPSLLPSHGDLSTSQVLNPIRKNKNKFRTHLLFLHHNCGKPKKQNKKNRNQTHLNNSTRKIKIGSKEKMKIGSSWRRYTKEIEHWTWINKLQDTENLLLDNISAFGTWR